MIEDKTARRLREVLAAVKLLAAEYYVLTGKPLGVTGEVAEYVVAETLGLELAPPRTAGYDATRHTPEGKQRVQIKGRAYGADAKPGQRIGRIKKGAACDKVLLVLLDNKTLELREMWEADYRDVAKRLDVPGSKARERGSLGVSEFKRLGGRSGPSTRRRLFLRAGRPSSKMPVEDRLGGFQTDGTAILQPGLALRLSVRASRVPR